MLLEFIYSEWGRVAQIALSLIQKNKYTKSSDIHPVGMASSKTFTSEPTQRVANNSKPFVNLYITRWARWAALHSIIYNKITCHFFISASSIAVILLIPMTWISWYNVLSLHETTAAVSDNGSKQIQSCVWYIEHNTQNESG